MVFSNDGKWKSHISRLLAQFKWLQRVGRFSARAIPFRPLFPAIFPAMIDLRYDGKNPVLLLIFLPFPSSMITL